MDEQREEQLDEQPEEQFEYQPPQTEAPASGLAIGSLVSSILGLTFVPLAGSIVGLVLGYMARKAIQESAGTVGGDGLAKAGVIIGWVGVGLSAAACCLVVLAVLLFVPAGGVFQSITRGLH